MILNLSYYINVLVVAVFLETLTKESHFLHGKKMLFTYSFILSIKN